MKSTRIPINMEGISGRVKVFIGSKAVVLPGGMRLECDSHKDATLLSALLEKLVVAVHIETPED